ncbi:hypothetical protein P170DRAFT_431770 [Aspergillus steynii IBT 23096]|uniref:GPI anchored protein n=1 Tax=Aspergillus steynii IBT 23096 TaxID=1392250 RepID=A0A2I2GMK6_9EURO|nr:uncharacterized protein P170DRAFT_431770 [Aspergillus steynii IBT 23096]PLB54095.1 hypothetical protein P170DRAFT_431770 [Aspergillus steynii IBT 23096]
MRLKFLAGLAVLGLVTAKDSVSSMFIYGADEQPLVASIVGNDATVTSYNINCRPGTDDSDCGMGAGVTLLADDPMTTYMMDDPSGGKFFAIICSVDQKDSTAVCRATVSTSSGSSTALHTSTTTTRFSRLPVTITGGEITSATPTWPGTSTSHATATGTGTTTQTGSSSTSSGGGMARVTGDTGMMLGAAAVGLAALL